MTDDHYANLTPHGSAETSAFLSVNVNAKKLHNIRLAKQCNYNNNKLEIKRGVLE